MLATETNSMDNEQISIRQSFRTTRKTAQKRYKLLLTCVVCNGEAHGYNFDAISCESCKAFFRRNALRPPEKLKCVNTGLCDVTFTQRKRCKKCRLDKCFRKGMRKEWILSETEKQEKRMKIEQNRLLKPIQEHRRDSQINRKILTKSYINSSIELHKLSSLIDHSTNMINSDWLKLEFLRNAYIEAVKLNQTTGISQYPLVQSISSTLELFSGPIYISSMRLITYFKQIPEFQQFTKDEQIYFVKINALSITFLHSMYIYDDKNKVYHEPDTNDPLFLEKDYINTINREFHNEMKKIQNNFHSIENFDENLIKTFFLIILFCNHLDLKQSSMNINTLKIFKIQNIYIELFYKYCLHQYGFHRSSIILLQYTTNLIKIQKLITIIKSTACNYMDIKLLTPVMQSLL